MWVKIWDLYRILLVFQPVSEFRVRRLKSRYQGNGNFTNLKYLKLTTITKKRILLIFFIALGTFAFAQNIGIGTNDPDPNFKLHVNGNVHTDGTIFADNITIKGSAAGENAVALGASTNASQAVWIR